MQKVTRNYKLEATAGARSSARQRRGFTLVELLVVIALLTILFVLLFKPLMEGFNWLQTTRANVSAQHSAQYAMESFSRDLALALEVKTYPDTPWLVDLFMPVMQNGKILTPLRRSNTVIRYWDPPLLYYAHPAQPQLTQDLWDTVYSNPDLGDDWTYTGDPPVANLPILFSLIHLYKTSFEPYVNFTNNGAGVVNPNIPHWDEPFCYTDYPTEGDYWQQISRSVVPREKSDCARYIQDPGGSPEEWPETADLKGDGSRYVVPGCTFKPVQITGEIIYATDHGTAYKSKYGDWYEDNRPNRGDRYIATDNAWLPAAGVAWSDDSGGHSKFDDPHIQIWRWNSGTQSYSTLVFDSFPAAPATNYYTNGVDQVHFTWDSRKGVVKFAVPYSTLFNGDGAQRQFALRKPTAAMIVPQSVTIELHLPSGAVVSCSQVKELPSVSMSNNYVYTLDAFNGLVTFGSPPPANSFAVATYEYRDNFTKDTTVSPQSSKYIRNDLVVLSYKTQRYLDVQVSVAVKGARRKHPEIVVLTDRLEVGSKLH